ncbi:MAG: phosphoserine phosphatase SerB [Gammaproteobacteria bacterium]|nr:phosphoserine phosphatase SerB [Gammaproteobacteria bacterium]
MSGDIQTTTLIIHGEHLNGSIQTVFGGWLDEGELIECPGYHRLVTRRPVSDSDLALFRQGVAVDINRLPASFSVGRTRLVVSDMDSTLIGIECIDEIADYLSIKPQVAAITESAMRGEIDFETSLRRRVALLAGLEAETLERVYEERLFLNPGAEALLDGLRLRGIRFALVSGGFTFFTDRLKARLGLDYTLANTLEIREGRLTGKVEGDIVGAQAKADLLDRLCDELEISHGQTVAMGDGANDLVMMGRAGLSVAYHAKPAVQERASCALNHGGLDSVLHLIG